jgi:hypothetical protein
VLKRIVLYLAHINDTSGSQKRVQIRSSDIGSCVSLVDFDGRESKFRCRKIVRMCRSVPEASYILLLIAGKYNDVEFLKHLVSCYSLQ